MFTDPLRGRGDSASAHTEKPSQPINNSYCPNHCLIQTKQKCTGQIAKQLLTELEIQLDSSQMAELNFAP